MGEPGEVGIDRAARAEILFPQHLERVTRWLRREVYRLGHLPDEVVLDGDVHSPRSFVADVVGPPTAAVPEPETPPVVSAYTRI